MMYSNIKVAVECVVDAEQQLVQDTDPTDLETIDDLRRKRLMYPLQIH